METRKSKKNKLPIRKLSSELKISKRTITMKLLAVLLKKMKKNLKS